jgi:arabinogalactan oligomer/maltooligosaccharide transport system permease protein
VKRLHVAWCYAVALCASIFAPAPARADQTLKLWHAYTGKESDALAQAVRAFERTHPGVHVNVLGLPFGAYASKLEAAIPAGSGPDLFIDAHERLPVYLERGLLDPLASSTSAALDGAFAAKHLDVLTQNEERYGVPLSVKCVALYVNTQLAPGSDQVASFADLAALRARLARDAYPLAFEADNPYYFAAFLRANGGELLAHDGRYGFVGVPAERTLALFRRWSEERVLPEEPSADLTKRLFAAGKVVAMLGGPWVASDLPKGLPWQVLPLPPLERDGAALSPFVTIEAAFFAHRTGDTQAHADALRELALFLALGEGALVRAEQGAQVVAANSLPRAIGGPHAALIDVFRRAAQLGEPMSVHPNMRRVWEPVQRAAKKALRGDGDLQAALQEGERRFAEAVRPLPRASSPAPFLLLFGVVLLGLTVLMVRKGMEPAFRARFRASLPAYAYLTHAFVAVLLLVMGPLLIGALTSFYAGKGRDLYFVGLANYADILTARGGELLASGSFYLVLLVTILWTVANLTVHVSLGVGLALLLVRVTGTLSRMYRVLLILPWAVPSYVTALAWRGMFHRQFGAINAMLSALGAEPVSWFAKFSTAFSANLATNAWLGFPFMMVVTLGALTSIPKDLYEAASVDGASGLEQLRMVTLPMIRPVLAPAVAMGAVWTFNMFNVIFLVSGGEPDGKSEILVSEAYRWAFTRSSQYGYAAAYAVLIFGILVMSTRVLGPWLQEKRA